MPSIHERLICNERLLAYLPPGHELLARPRIRQADLMEEHVWLLSEGHCFRTQVLHLCGADQRHARGRHGNVAFEGAGFEALIGLVDAGFGVTVRPELVVRGPPPDKADRVRPFGAPEPVRAIGLVPPVPRVRAEVADVLFELLRQAAPPPAGGGAARSVVLPPRRPTRRSPGAAFGEVAMSRAATKR